MSYLPPLAPVDGPLAPALPHFLPPPWYSKGCYLTRSMTLSRGASLTVSSLMAKIWSPGRSFPKEGPSADTVGHKVTYDTVKGEVSLSTSYSFINILVFSISVPPSHIHIQTNRQRRIVQWQASGCPQWSRSLESGGAGWWPVELRQDLGYHCPYHLGSLTLQSCRQKITFKWKNNYSHALFWTGDWEMCRLYKERLQIMCSNLYLSHSFVCPSWTLAIPWEKGAAWKRDVLQRPLSVSQSFTWTVEKKQHGIQAKE